MKIETVIYLIEIISNIDNFLNAIFFLGITIMIISGAIYLLNIDDNPNIARKMSKILKKFWFLPIVLSINVFFPEKNSMYLMLGAKYLSQSNIPTKVEKALNLKIDNYIDELKRTVYFNEGDKNE